MRDDGRLAIERANHVSELDYEAAIPKCCAFQTMEEHRAMLLCWSLCAALRENTEMDCKGCELNTDEHPRKSSNAGFTLLELLLVMLALFCLGSVAIVAYSRYLNLQQVCHS